MLQSLFIQNFVLIDQLEIDFHAKMSVFTGETGAGKSIIIGALSLALGNRADTQTIGPFGEQCEIIAEFKINDNDQVIAWLKEQDLINDSELIIRRTVNKQGRSKQWVNGRPTPSGLVKELSQYLLQIHGQHDQVRLLKNNNQRLILDQSGNYQDTLIRMRDKVKSIQELESQIESLKSAGSMSQDQAQLLKYQSDELTQLALEADEYESLHQALKTASNAQELIQNIDQSISILSTDDLSVENQLGHVINKLSQSQGQDFSEICQMLEESLINVNEANNELNAISEKIDSNPENLAQIENRLEQITHIARKQNVMPELLFQHQLDLQETLNTHANLAKNQNKLNNDIEDAINQYRTLSQKLHQQRKKAAKSLAANITSMIQELGLPEAQFSIAVEHNNEASPKALGNDHIEFMIAANKGQKSQPLNKTASGGELSRISLAIEVSTQHDHNQVFVFDEVDTGIGGATAEKVGQIMQQLSAQNQVFAVTHLPQVAGHAHDHLLVSKSSHGKYTTSKVNHLSEEQRIQELARMSGGQNITEATLAQAKEFLKTG